MTINEAITLHKQRVPATKLTEAQIIDALSRLDRNVYLNIICAHEGSHGEFTPYTEETGFDTELLIPSPYDDIYADWLDVQNELVCKNHSRYNNAVAIYDKKYQEYASFYTRNNLPKSKTWRFF